MAEVEAGTTDAGKADAASAHLAVDVGQLRFLERLFHEKYGPFMLKYRIPLAIFFVAFYCVSIVFAVQLEPGKEPAQWLPSSDPIQMMFTLETDTFKAQSMTQQIWFSEGLGLIDRTGSNVYNADEIGDATYAPNFNPSTPEAQLAAVAQCARLRKMDFVRLEEVLCPMDDFRDYIENTINETFPVPTVRCGWLQWHNRVWVHREVCTAVVWRVYAV